jgi:hypothetical protein
MAKRALILAGGGLKAAFQAGVYVRVVTGIQTGTMRVRRSGGHMLRIPWSTSATVDHARPRVERWGSDRAINRFGGFLLRFGMRFSGSSGWTVLASPD